MTHVQRVLADEETSNHILYFEISVHIWWDSLYLMIMYVDQMDTILSQITQCLHSIDT